jgi:hypothetical protein
MPAQHPPTKPSKRCIEGLVGIKLEMKQYDALVKSLQRMINEACYLAKKEKTRRGHAKVTVEDMNTAIKSLTR